MPNEQKVTDWLVNNADLSWKRTGGDTPAVRADRLYLNRSEGYEIRDFILSYYAKFNLTHKPENYAITLRKILRYKPSEKVKTVDVLNYLSKAHEKS
ncbi:hypothetical protein ACEWBY_09395 [Vibrio parahaemolyticus]